jgi:hypothetical protein
LAASPSPITTSGTLSINTAVVPQLAANNTFTGTNKFTGSTTAAAVTATSLTASGAVSGSTISGSTLNATGGLYLYGNTSFPFAFSTGSGDNAFLGYAGNPQSLNPGDMNTAIGFRAMQALNGCCGFNVASNNTATGGSALYNTTTGAFNTASGASALSNNVTGSSNTALGYSAGPDSASAALTNSTAIGAYAVVSQSNSLVLGSIANTNGCVSPCLSTSVGIGTATPQATLDVVGGANFSGTVNITNLNVTGTLSKPAGTFKIDHPLDPANKYLYHSFVESPDMMNVYNGNINTDGSGLATVTLPDWFEALNRDFRYQLTVIGQFAQAIVASEVSHNQFTIRTDRPNVKVSWQVTGIRQDAYANAHRVQVEEDKPPQEQGRYLHPELFGALPEQAVGYRAPATTFAAQAPVSTLHQ